MLYASPIVQVDELLDLRFPEISSRFVDRDVGGGEAITVEFIKE